MRDKLLNSFGENDAQSRKKWNLGHFGPFGPKFRAFRVIQANPAS